VSGEHFPSGRLLLPAGRSGVRMSALYRARASGFFAGRRGAMQLSTMRRSDAVNSISATCNMAWRTY
jgi:hypothetical protein